MEGDAVVEGNEEAGSSGAEPGECIPADGEQHEGHIELKRLRGPLRRREAVPHHMERRPLPVLDEFPHE